MGMVALTQQWHTPASVRRRPADGNRYECIAGELLVTPAPRTRHQAVVGELFLALQPVRQFAGFRVLMSPADLELRVDALVQPDLFVLHADRPLREVEWSDVRAIELAVEVLSPSTARHDRITKRQFYQDVRVPEYWIVDADARLVERWRPGDERPEICSALLEWLPVGARAPIVVDLPALFRAALDA